MGQAKQRGSFEERKAIAQPKKKKPSKQEQRHTAIAGGAYLAAKVLEQVGIVKK